MSEPQTETYRAWQPFETVPKDGTPVLVWLPTKMGQSHVHAARWAPCANGIMGVIGNVFDFDASCKPTHWMPQPGAPNV